MAESGAETAVGSAELAALKLLALEGALEGETKVSCSDLGTRLDASSQTASRRLQALENGGYVERELASDGQLVTVTASGERALRREYEAYRRIFEDSGVELRGTVTSGMGEGRHYIALSGYQEQFVERLGYEPFPGTLNVSLRNRMRGGRSALAGIDGIPIDAWEDEERTYGAATCYAVSLRTEAGDQYDDAHAIVPDRTHHDDDELELIAPDRLRDALDLTDGDHLSIHVDSE